MATDEEKATCTKQKQKGLDIEYKVSLHMLIECKCMLEENKAKAFSLITNKYCTKEIQNIIQTNPKYDTKLIDDPIKLINAIKVLIHDTTRAQYPIASIVLQLTKWLNIKQHKDKNLMEYVKRTVEDAFIVTTSSGTVKLHVMDTFTRTPHQQSILHLWLLPKTRQIHGNHRNR